MSLTTSKIEYLEMRCPVSNIILKVGFDGHLLEPTPQNYPDTGTDVNGWMAVKKILDNPNYRKKIEDKARYAKMAWEALEKVPTVDNKRSLFSFLNKTIKFLTFKPYNVWK